jgi:hypothetical protein
MSRPRDPGWLLDTQAAGPNGVRFDTGIRPAVLDPAFVAGNIMEDDTDTNQFTRGCAAYAGYYNGTYANMTAVRAYAATQNARSFSYTPDGDPGANAIDIEPGCSAPGDFPGFYRAKSGKGVYGYGSASWVSLINSAAQGAGIARSSYKIVSAHYIGPHICGPGSCGYPQADATQFTSTYAGRSLDATQFNSTFFGTPTPPPPPPPAKGTFAAPTGFLARGGHTTVYMEWHAVHSTIMGHPVTGYEVVIYNDPPILVNGHWKVVKILPNIHETHVQTGGLVQGKGYQAHIWALGSPVSSQHNYATARFRTA